MDSVLGRNAAGRKVLKVGKELRRALLVIAAIAVCDRNLRELFFGNIVQASKINSIHFSDRRFIPDAEATNPATLAKVVVILLCIK